MSKNHLLCLIISLLTGGCDLSDKTQAEKMNLEYLSSKKLESYPSGSTLSVYKDQVYIMGDDASSLIILDTNLKVIDSIPLFGNDRIRIEKAKKADIESSEWLQRNGKTQLWLFGSGSLSPQRDSAFCFDPATRKTERVDLADFYEQINQLGIKVLNIEAATLIDTRLVFGNRGNLKNKENYLVFTSAESFPAAKELSLILLEMPENAGISGMTYLAEEDVLLITASEENTSSAYDDGEIGESYLGIINQAYEKLSCKKLSMDIWIKLSALHPDLSGQKIESVCTFGSGKNQKLLLVSDDDKGGTRLFNFNMIFP